MSFLDDVTTSVGGVGVSEVDDHPIEWIEDAATVETLHEHPRDEVVGVRKGELDVSILFHGAPTSSGAHGVLPVQSFERFGLRAENVFVSLDGLPCHLGVDLGVDEGDSTFYILLRHTGTVDLVEA